jgi:membrane-associated protease RseP (regulator of RpoE activity)
MAQECNSEDLCKKVLPSVLPLSIEGKDGEELTMKSSDPELGSKAYEVGASKGLEFSIIDCLLRQVKTMKEVNVYQHSCPTLQGNNGGPVISVIGEVLGDVSNRFFEGQNLTIAIPIAYVLALDPTLATKPWSTIKAAKPLPGTGSKPRTSLTDAEFDAMLFRSFAFLYNAEVAYRYLESEVVERNNGYRAGIPAFFYARSRAINEAVVGQIEIASTDHEREAIRKDLLKSLAFVHAANEQIVHGVLTASQNGGWTATSTSYRNDAISFMDDFHKLDMRNRLAKLIESSSEFKARCPSELKSILAASADIPSFDSGLSAFTDSPQCQLAAVYINRIGYKIGFRVNDIVVSVDEKVVKSVVEIKRVLAANAGKKVKAVVIRLNKLRSIELRVPADLSKY